MYILRRKGGWFVVDGVWSSVCGVEKKVIVSIGESYEMEFWCFGGGDGIEWYNGSFVGEERWWGS